MISSFLTKKNLNTFACQGEQLSKICDVGIGRYHEWFIPLWASHVTNTRWLNVARLFSKLPTSVDIAVSYLYLQHTQMLLKILGPISFFVLCYLMTAIVYFHLVCIFISTAAIPKFPFLTKVRLTRIGTVW